MTDQASDQILQNTRLGTLLIQKQQITERQLANALREHLLTEKRLGDVLVDRGLVPRSVIDYYTLEQYRLRHLFDERENFYRESSRLGDLLEAAELVSSQDIDAALEEQRKTGEALGDILVQRGLISPTVLDEVLALQQRFRRTAISAMLSLVASLVSIPHVNSANVSVTGQMAITLRFTEAQRPVLLKSPEMFDENENLNISLDASGRLHRLALHLDETELILEVDSAAAGANELNRSGPNQHSLQIDDYELEFQLEDRENRGGTMSIYLSPT